MQGESTVVNEGNILAAMKKYKSIDDVRADIEKMLPLKIEVSDNMREFGTTIFVRPASESSHYNSGIKQQANYEIPIPPQFSFTDENGEYRTTRYMPGSRFIDLQAQIREGYAANAKIPNREKLKMIGGEAYVDDVYTAWFLLAANCPSNADFKGDAPGFSPRFVIVDEKKEENKQYKRTKLITKVSDKISKLSDDSIRELLIEFEGVSVTIPKEKEALFMALFNCVNSSPDNERAERVISYVQASDDKAETPSMTVSKALEAGILVFDIANGLVSIKKGKKTVTLTKISAESTEQQQSALVAFLSTTEGVAHLKELEEILKNVKDE